jgi:hypothetical protein
MKSKRHIDESSAANKIGMPRVTKAKFEYIAREKKWALVTVAEEVVNTYLKQMGVDPEVVGKRQRASA